LAHDNDFGVIHPGLIVIKKMIQRCYELNLQFMDFSTGDEAYKQDWAEDHDTFCQVIFGSETPAARMYVSAAILKDKLRCRLKNYKKLVYFKRVTLGRIKYTFSGAPIYSFIKKICLELKLRSLGNLLCCIAKKIALKTGISGQYRLFRIEGTYRYKPKETGLAIRPAELDRLGFLSNLTAVHAENIVRRYKNKERCCLLYDGDRIAGSVWISGTQLGDTRRIWWKAENSNDRCIYEFCLFRKLSVDECKEILCRLAKECAGAVKSACVHFLVHRFDRNLLRAASGFRKGTSCEIPVKEVPHEVVSD